MDPMLTWSVRTSDTSMTVEAMSDALQLGDAALEECLLRLGRFVFRVLRDVPEIFRLPDQLRHFLAADRLQDAKLVFDLLETARRQDKLSFAQVVALPSQPRRVPCPGMGAGPLRGQTNREALA